MAISDSDLNDLLDVIRSGGDIDVIRHGITMLLQGLIDAELADENHGKSPRSITEIPHPLSDEVDDKVHHNEVGPFKAGGAYANQPEGTHSPCSHREKTWKHTHSTNGDGRSPPSPDTSVGIARRSGPTSTGQGSRASELAQPLIPSSPIATT